MKLALIYVDDKFHAFHIYRLIVDLRYLPGAIEKLEVLMHECHHFPPGLVIESEIIITVLNPPAIKFGRAERRIYFIIRKPFLITEHHGDGYMVETYG